MGAINAMGSKSAHTFCRGLCDHAAGPVCANCGNDLRAKEPHEVPADGLEGISWAPETIAAWEARAAAGDEWAKRTLAAMRPEPTRLYYLEDRHANSNKVPGETEALCMVASLVATMTQVRLAQELGVTTGVVSRWNAGKCTPQPRHRVSIRAIYLRLLGDL